MVDYPHGGAASVFRDFQEDGNPVSDRREPPKYQIRDLLGLYEQLIETLQAATGDPDAIDEILDAFANKADKSTGGTGTGAAVVTGNLGTGLTVSVPKASEPDAIAGLNDNDVMTPATTKAAISANVASFGPIGTSWDRRTNVDGLTATMFDVNLQKFLRSDGKAWRNDGLVAQASPAYLLDAIGLTTDTAFSLNRRLRAAYAGPLGRVKRTSDGATLDYKTVAEAIAFGPDKVVGWGQQATGSTVAEGTIVAFGSELDFVNDRGFIGAKNPSTTATVLGYAMSPTDRGHYGNTTGCTFATIIRSPMPYVSFSANSSWTIFRITNSANGNRHLCRVSSGGYLEFAGRRLDADSEGTLSFDKVFGGMRALAWNVDNLNAKVRFLRDGKVTRDKAWKTSGSTSGTTPTVGEIRVLPSHTVYEAVAFAAPLDATQELALLVDQMAFNIASRTLVNAANSWWSDVCAAHPELAITAAGFTGTHGRDGGSTDVGFQGVAEFDNITGEIIDYKILETGRYSQDDHLTTTLRYLTDGSLVVALIGHSNALSGTDADNGRVAVFYSATGRIADLGGAITLPSTMTRANYGWWIENIDKLLLWTNDDATVGWRLFYAAGKDVNAFVESRNIVQQGAAPGGGQNQMYSLVAQRGNTAFFICTAHSTNLQNPFRICWLDIPSGNVYGDLVGSAASRGNAYSTGAALCGMTTIPAIYTPPAGRSARLNDAVMEVDWGCIAGCEFDNVDGGNGQHFLLIWDGVGAVDNPASWAKKVVGASGVEFWTNGHYTPDIKIAREPHPGLRIYRTFNVAGVWYRERRDSPNNGETYRTTPLGSDASYPIPRIFTPRNARPELPAFYLRGTYIEYTNWRLDMTPILAAA
jgi:hypothetical protein